MSKDLARLWRHCRDLIPHKGRQWASQHCWESGTDAAAQGWTGQPPVGEGRGRGGDKTGQPSPVTPPSSTSFPGGFRGPVLMPLPRGSRAGWAAPSLRPFPAPPQQGSDLRTERDRREASLLPRGICDPRRSPEGKQPLAVSGARPKESRSMLGSQPPLGPWGLLPAESPRVGPAPWRQQEPDDMLSCHQHAQDPVGFP